MGHGFLLQQGGEFRQGGALGLRRRAEAR